MYWSLRAHMHKVLAIQKAQRHACVKTDRWMQLTKAFGERSANWFYHAIRRDVKSRDRRWSHRCSLTAHLIATTGNLRHPHQHRASFSTVWLHHELHLLTWCRVNFARLVLSLCEIWPEVVKWITYGRLNIDIHVAERFAAPSHSLQAHFQLKSGFVVRDNWCQHMASSHRFTPRTIIRPSCRCSFGDSYRIGFE